MLSAKLYCWFHGNYVLVTALLWLAIVMLCLPFCTRVWYLHCLFAALGFGTVSQSVTYLLTYLLVSS